MVIGTLVVDEWAVTFWHSEEGPGRAAAPPNPLLAVPNVTAHPSTVSVPTSYYSTWHCNYLCTIKGQLTRRVKLQQAVRLLAPIVSSNDVQLIK